MTDEDAVLLLRQILSPLPAQSLVGITPVAPLAGKVEELFRPSRPPAPQVAKGSVVKGSRVRLSDGRVAQVQYVDAHMRIARVRTADGKNITVRHKQLRLLPGE